MARSNYAASVADGDVLTLCVVKPDQFDLTYLRRVVRQIGEQRAASAAYKAGVTRSTFRPKSTHP